MQHAMPPCALRRCAANVSSAHHRSSAVPTCPLRQPGARSSCKQQRRTICRARPGAFATESLEKAIQAINKYIFEYEERRRLARGQGPGVVSGAAESSDPFARGKSITFRASASAQKTVREPKDAPSRALSAYLALPLDQYSLLDPGWISRQGDASDRFVLRLPLFDLVGLDMQPQLSVRVALDPRNSQVNFYADKFQLGDPRFDADFKLDMHAALRNRPARAPLRRLRRMLRGGRGANTDPEPDPPHAPAAAVPYVLSATDSAPTAPSSSSSAESSHDPDRSGLSNLVAQREEEGHGDAQEVRYGDDGSATGSRTAAAAPSAAEALPARGDTASSSGPASGRERAGLAASSPQDAPGSADGTNGSSHAAAVTAQGPAHAATSSPASSGTGTTPSISTDSGSETDGSGSSGGDSSQAATGRRHAALGGDSHAAAAAAPAAPPTVAQQQQQPQQQQPGDPPSAVLLGSVSMGVTVTLPPPLSAVPTFLLSTTCSLVARLAMQNLLPSFLDLLAVDYSRWSSGQSVVARAAPAGDLSKPTAAVAEHGAEEGDSGSDDGGGGGAAAAAAVVVVLDVDEAEEPDPDQQPQGGLSGRVVSAAAVKEVEVKAGPGVAVAAGAQWPHPGRERAIPQQQQPPPQQQEAQRRTALAAAAAAAVTAEQAGLN